MFGANKGFTIAAYTLLAITIAGGAGFLVTAVFQCSPIEAAWKPEVHHEYCINLPKYSLSTAITNNVLDIAVLILPLVMVGHLKGHSIKRKIAISAIYLIGTLSVSAFHIFLFIVAVTNSYQYLCRKRSPHSHYH